MQNKDYNIRKDQDLLFRSWITGTFTEESLYYVLNMNSVKEIWDVLEDNLFQALRIGSFN